MIKTQAYQYDSLLLAHALFLSEGCSDPPRKGQGLLKLTTDSLSQIGPKGKASYLI